jgi:hypothetical protein
VTWDDPNGDGTGNTSVKARIFTIDAQGNAVAAGGEILVNTATAGTQRTPSVTALSDGRFVVAWEDNNVADIKARIFMQMANQPLANCQSSRQRRAVKARQQ